MEEIKLTWTVEEKIGKALINPYCYLTELSIIIVVFNKFNFTQACLDDLFKLNDFSHEIIVIDNGSSDETQLELSKLQNRCKFHYVRNEENIFHSKACNQGFKRARGKNIMFLNNDIRVKSNHENWTQSVIDACANGEIVGPTMGLLDMNLNFVKEANEQLEGNSYLSGWCIAASRETWMKLSPEGRPWGEDFQFYYNDGDLSLRAKEKDIKQKVISVPDVIHFGRVSAAQINVQKLYNEGRKVFLEKWGNK